MVEAKTALVTGGAGFIGSHLVVRLLSLGYKVVVIDNLSTGQRQNLDPAAVFHAIDLTQPAVHDVFQRERPDLVFHLAAQTSVIKSTRAPVQDAAANVIGTVNLLEEARQGGVKKFVYSSTGGALYGDPKTNPCTEQTPITPLSPYGLSKYLAEEYLGLYHRLYRLNATALRYGNVYGPRQDPYGEAGVVAIFSQAMLEGKPVEIFGDGQQERDFVYVDDVVEANLRAIERGNGHAFNIGTGTSTSVNRIFELLKGLSDYQREPVRCPPRPGEVYKISLSYAKAEKELGWWPQVGLEQGLGQTVEYFRTAKAGA